MKIKEMIETAKIVAGLVPLTIQLVNEIETAIDKALQGKEKIQLLIITIEAVINESLDVAENIKNRVLKIINGFVEGLISIYNKIGIFKTTKK